MFDLAWMQFYIAKSWVNLQQDAEAIPLFEAAAAGFEKTDQATNAANMFDWIGDSRRTLGDREGAVAYRECVRRCAAIGYDSTLSKNAQSLGEELLDLDRPQEALDAFEQAVAAYSRLEQPTETAECLILAGSACRELEQWKQAAEHYTAAIDLLTKNDKRPRAAHAGREMGEAFIQAGHAGLARNFLLVAEKTFRELNEEEAANQIRDLLAGQSK
jgi:tetratricopeptide (TPR) repeat protein